MNPRDTAFWESGEGFIASSGVDTASLDAFVNSHDETRHLIFFQTSGSEGVPKWVGLSREAMFASARAVNTHLEASAKDCWLIALPLHHVGGFSILARCHMSGALWVQMSGKWDAKAFAERCEKEKITLTSLVPTQVFDLVEAKLPAPSSLRAIVVGGGRLEKTLGTRAFELGWPVLQSYGMTEAGSQIATEPLDHLYAGFDPDRLEVLPGWDLRADDEEHLILRGSALAAGYAGYREGAWTWEPLDPQAGLRTRDRVQLWDHGTRKFLRFIGRESSFVKVLGELVNLDELQRKADTLKVDAGTVVIWPEPDVRKETQLILIGECSADQLEILRGRFNAEVRGFERISAVRSVPEIPRTALGKIDRPALAALLARS